MIRFAVPASGPIHLRIAWSPLWECGSSVRVLRALALHGAGAGLGGLHPAVRHRDGIVEVESPRDGDVAESATELLLVPSIFSWPDVFTVHAPAWRSSIYYPARGIGTLWDGTDPDRSPCVYRRSAAGWGVIAAVDDITPGPLQGYEWPR